MEWRNMKEMGKPRYHQLILFLFLLCSRLNIGQNKAYAQGTTSNNSRNTTSSFDVGVILDTKTWVGNISWRCMAMAMEDFYNSHSNFTKKLSLHLRDANKDDRVASASAGLFSLSISLFICFSCLDLSFSLHLDFKNCLCFSLAVSWCEMFVILFIDVSCCLMEKRKENCVIYIGNSWFHGCVYEMQLLIFWRMFKCKL